MKKFSLFLVMTCLFTWSVKAQTTVQIGDLYYALNEDLTAEVVVIPDETPDDPWDNTRYALAEITVPATVENGGKTYNVVKIGTNALRSNPNLKNVTLPASVKTIGNGAFAGNENLEQVSGTQHASFIDEWAFHECKKLRFALLSKDLKAIKAHCFQNCEALTGILLPEGLTTIEGCAFQSCYMLKTTIPSTVTAIDSWAFIDTAIEKVIIPEGVTTLNGCTFGGNDENNKNSVLTSITLPASLTKLGNWAFDKCANIQKIYINWATAPEANDDVIGFWGFGKFEKEKGKETEGRTTCTVYVPAAHREAYGETWFDFPVQTKPSGIASLKPEEARVSYADGALNLFDMDGYAVSVFSANGQLAAAFKADQPSVQLPLASGVYILNASKGQAQKIAKFMVE